MAWSGRAWPGQPRLNPDTTRRGCPHKALQRPTPRSPFIPAQAGIHFGKLGPRFRGTNGIRYPSFRSFARTRRREARAASLADACEAPRIRSDTTENELFCRYLLATQ